MILQINSTKNFELIIKLLEVLIWPITLLIILFVFRKYFIGALKRLGSITASSTGISMTFDKKIEAAKKLLQNIKPKVISKTTTGLNIEVDKSKRTPFSELQKIDTELTDYITNIAKTNNIDTTNKSSLALCNQLQEVGVITIQKSKLIKSLLDIVLSANMSFSEKHLKVVKDIFRAIIK